MAKRLISIIPLGGHEERKIWIAYLLHGMEVSKSQYMVETMKMERIELLHRIGRCQESIGQYEAAENALQTVLEFRSKVLGEEHPDTLTSMNDLTGALHNQGKYVEAETMHREALALRKKVLGEEHPDTLTSMNDLAVALRDQGKYVEAETMYREALALGKKVLGEEHPDTLTSMDNLAVVLHDQGKYVEAEIIQQQILKLKEHLVL